MCGLNPHAGEHGLFGAGEEERQPRGRVAPPRDVPRDPRHVRAVPTTADVKVERALELFNASEHARSIAGIMRSLGEPWVAAADFHPGTLEQWLAERKEKP